MKTEIESAGGMVEIIAPHLGFINSAGNKPIKVNQSFLTAASVLFDAVYVPGGAKSVSALKLEPDAIHFVNEAYKHCKAIAASAEGVGFLDSTAIGAKLNLNDDKAITNDGVVLDKNPSDFIKAIAQHRFWDREKPGKVPA
jgi:catalase